MKRFLAWLLRRPGGAAEDGSPPREPFAAQFEAIVRDDWRERIAALQATCAHPNTCTFRPVNGAVRVICSNCGAEVQQGG